MKIALNNPHLNPLFSYHGYVKYLLEHEEVNVLFFSDHRALSFLKGLKSYIKRNSLINSLNLEDYDIVFSAKSLSARADVLLDMNLLCGSLECELPESLKHFDGLKVAHIGDYFWYHPASSKNKRLEAVGIDHLLGYSMHDRYCGFFHEKFPKYREKTWGIPFGFNSRFSNKKNFQSRINKAVAVGSVNPLRPPPVDSKNYIESSSFFMNNDNNYIESSEFYINDDWSHRFRKKLSESKQNLNSVMDSMLPEFPKIKDTRYNLPKKFNDYKMFVSCESIYNFPSAKVYEGMASGSVLICADHDCNKDVGLKDNENCIMFEYESIEEFSLKVKYFQENPKELENIGFRGEKFIQSNYTHRKISDHIVNIITKIIEDPSINASPMRNFL